MMPPHCSEMSLDSNGVPHACVMEAGHEDNHMDRTGRIWEPPGTVLARLQETWGRTHRVIWTGRMWMATAHRADVDWRTETEPTPDQLEESLLRHGYQPTLARSAGATETEDAR